MELRIQWLPFRNTADGFNLTISYIDMNGNYYLFVEHNQNRLVCVLQKGTANAVEFEQNYRESSTPLISE